MADLISSCRIESRDVATVRATNENNFKLQHCTNQLGRETTISGAASIPHLPAAEVAGLLAVS